MSLSERTRTGLREMPSNAAWAPVPSPQAGRRGRDGRRLRQIDRSRPTPEGDGSGGRCRSHRPGLGGHPHEARPGRRGAGPRGRGAGPGGRAGVQGLLRPCPAGERARSRPRGRGGPRDGAPRQATHRRGPEGRRRGRGARTPGGRGGGREEQQEIRAEVAERSRRRSARPRSPASEPRSSSRRRPSD
jgi:hypothetical protein